MKSHLIAYLLWACGLIGLCGLHRIYLGKVFTGLLWLFTLGLFFFGQFIDLFLIPAQVENANLKMRLEAGGRR